jgi:hypothetical protein
VKSYLLGCLNTGEYLGKEIIPCYGRKPSRSKGVKADIYPLDSSTLELRGEFPEAYTVGGESDALQSFYTREHSAKFDYSLSHKGLTTGYANFGDAGCNCCFGYPADFFIGEDFGMG